MILTKISLSKSTLKLVWSDNKMFELNLLKIRKMCPCATCLAEREKQSKSYIPIFSKSQTSVKNISQVGNYAINISWNDGHNTGIYEFPFLRRLCEEE